MEAGNKPVNLALGEDEMLVSSKSHRQQMLNFFLLRFAGLRLLCVLSQPITFYSCSLLSFLLKVPQYTHFQIFFFFFSDSIAAALCN